MTPRKRSDDSIRRRALSRRRLLAGVGSGTLAAVAGCTGGGGSDGGDGGSDGGDGGSDGGDGGGGAGPVEDLCGRIPGEFMAYDNGETPWVFDHDIPSPFEGELENPPQSSNFVLNNWIISADSPRDLVSIEVTQFFPRESGATEPNDYSPRPETLEVEFAGERTTLYGPVEEDAASMEQAEIYNLKGDLLYTVGDTDVHFPIEIQTYLEIDSEISGIPDDCRASVEEVTRTIAESLRVNEATTVEQTLRDEWGDSP